MEDPNHDLLNDIKTLINRALAYDAAIQECAGDPDRMSSYCTAQGENLDELYAAWITDTRTLKQKYLGYFGGFISEENNEGLNSTSEG